MVFWCFILSKELICCTCVCMHLHAYQIFLFKANKFFVQLLMGIQF